MTVTPIDSRRGLTIGGSEAAAACGIDPYRSRVMLWAEKTGRVANEAGEPAYWGKLLEPVVYAELERRGFECVPAPADGFRDEQRPWLVGHPDGFASLDREPALLEIKTAGAWTGREWNDGETAPLHYQAQVQHYLALTGYETALLACLVAGQRLELRLVRRDDAAIARMIELEEELLDFCKRDVPPPPDGSGSTSDALAALYPTSDATASVRLDRERYADYLALKARKEQRDAIERQIAELEQRIKLAMGEAETAVSPHDEIVARWTSYNRRTIDTKALRDGAPSIAAKYETLKAQRRFTLE